MFKSTKAERKSNAQNYEIALHNTWTNTLKFWYSRLPVYQGPTPAYIVPILVLSGLPDWKCPAIGNIIVFNTTTGKLIKKKNIIFCIG